MKKYTRFMLFGGLILLMSACAAVQSIVRSTFPYTATIFVPASSRPGDVLSVTAQAGSLDQVFTGQGTNTSQVQDIRIASARLDATNPSDQNMGAFRTIRLFISRGDSSQEVLVATRNDIGTSVGRSIMLDIDNSKMLDEFIKGSTVRVRMEFVLREALPADLTIRTSLGFSVAPAAR